MVQLEREKKVCLGINPLLSPIAMGVTQDLALRNFFRKRIILGQENLPLQGPLVLAPTHRSRWDGLMLTMAAGRRVSKRDCRFMVTRSEMRGLQGWFLKRLGCFPIDQSAPSLASLRYSVDLLIAGQQLVVFPEGRISRAGKQKTLEQGLVRIVQLAYRKGIEAHILPVGLGYSEKIPKPCGLAAICFSEPIKISKLGKQAALDFNLILSKRMHAAEQAALNAVGRR